MHGSPGAEDALLQEELVYGDIAGGGHGADPPQELLRRPPVSR